MSVRKRSNGLATYQKMVQAAVSIMREEGPGGVTTARLAEASGIVQSGFYTHFKNVDEAIVAAAEQTGQRLREVIRSWRAEIVALGGGTVQQLAEHYAALLKLLLRERHFTELYLQYRRAPGSLGVVLRRFEANVLRDVSVHLEQMLHPSAPLQNTPLQDRDRRQAEQIVGLFWVAVDRALYAEGELADGDVERLALQLAVLIKASVELGYGAPDERFLTRVSLDLLKP